MLDKARVIGYIPMEQQKVKTRMSMLLGKEMDVHKTVSTFGP